jgi:hypothetical protein
LLKRYKFGRILPVWVISFLLIVQGVIAQSHFHDLGSVVAREGTLTFAQPGHPFGAPESDCPVCDVLAQVSATAIPPLTFGLIASDLIRDIDIPWIENDAPLRVAFADHQARSPPLASSRF